jgi:hypothetical protein
MTLNSLRGAAGSAFDNARSSLKAMADAAAAPLESEAVPAEKPVVAEKPAAPAAAAPSGRRGARQGVSLDSYA